MKRIAIVLVFAVALTMMFATTAYAEHRSAKYSSWEVDSGTNNVIDSPHAGYTATTVKCNVCHAVHNAAVPGQYIQNQPSGEWILADSADTQMLLRSSVAASCNYCHMDTSTGGVRLWNGNSANWGEDPVTEAEGAFDSGYGHGHSGCTGCHSVHGANTFTGAAAGKILKYTATNNITKTSHLGDPDGEGPLSADSTAYDVGINATVTGNVANHTYVNPVTGVSTLVGIQDEVFTADPAGVLVDPLNKPWFASLDDLIEGTNPINEAVGEDVKDLQVGGFCTMCHGNLYTSDSFQTINVDQDTSLFGGTFGPWTLDNAYMSKGHPVMNATSDFVAPGDTLPAGQTVAYSDANVCRKCHDAGSSDAAAGIVYSSFPHVTPGYLKFVGAGSDAASYATYATREDMVADSTLWLAGEEQVDLTLAAAGSYLYDGQNYKSNDPATDPMASDHLGVDGQCLKCHVSGTGLGVGLTY